VDGDRIRKSFLLILVIGVTLLFGVMLRPFLMSIFLAGIVAGLCHPFHRRLRDRLRGRRSLAALLTVLLLVLVVAAPLAGVLGVVAAQAVDVGAQVVPWVEKQAAEPDRLWALIAESPLLDRLAPYREPLLAKAGGLVGSTSAFLLRAVSSTTRGTVSAFAQIALVLYCLFFFLKDGERLMRRIRWYLPLDDDAEHQLFDRFTSVTRATLKGTLLIGLAQGVLAGAAFAVVGIDGAVFWGTVMVLLSVVPGVGTGLVWLPAAIVLAATGQPWHGLGLALFCGAVVGSIDNLLRPRLVGRDTKMHDLLILFGTLGGILLFGLLGFIVGPIVAALFVTLWELYGVAFRDVLPPVADD
jgi:predicted PurR-regulated permease PerM